MDTLARASANTSRQWLISLEQRHWDAIVSGDKRFEMRRRMPNALRSGDTVTVYVKKPNGLVCGSFEVAGVTEADTAVGLWARVCDAVPTTGMKQVLDYYDGARRFRAIEIGAVRVCEQWSLGKHPPQGVVRL